MYIVLLLGLFSLDALPQSYITSVGVRFGTDYGLTIQQRLLKHVTVEGIAQSSLHREELMITGLGEYHIPVFTKRLNFYVGGGFHQGFHTSNDIPFEPAKGISAVAGGEFTLARFTVSFDYKPAFNLSGGEKSWYMQSGVSVRYAIISQRAFSRYKKRRQRDKKREKRRKSREDFFEQHFNF
ncbi:MAG: hypothetical protein U9N85_06700 [Bacteroidota bacterium]|nr:hypothetical protein [Bacteroidota bacterium]